MEKKTKGSIILVLILLSLFLNIALVSASGDTVSTVNEDSISSEIGISSEQVILDGEIDEDPIESNDMESNEKQEIIGEDPIESNEKTSDPLSDGNSPNLNVNYSSVLSPGEDAVIKVNITDSDGNSLLDNGVTVTVYDDNYYNNNSLYYEVFTLKESSTHNSSSNFSLGSGIPKTKKKILLTSDNIYNYNTDLKFLNDIASILRSKGYTVTVDTNITPNAQNNNIWGNFTNTTIICIFGGCDSGMFVDMSSNWYQYYLNLYSNQVVLGFTHTERNLANETWLERAHDDNYSPASFTGLAYPGTYLNEHGFDYIYGRNASEMANNFLNYAVNGLSIGLNNTIPGGIITVNDTIRVNSSRLMDGHNYTISIHFNGSSYYEPFTREYSFKVMNRTPSIMVYGNAFSDNEDVMLELGLLNKYGEFISGTLNLKLGPNNYTVDLEDSPSRINLGQLPKGKYTINASFSGNNEYYSSNALHEFYVLKSAYLYIQSCDVLSGDNETINFTMTDSEGKPISNSIFVEIFDLKGHEIDFDYINLVGGKGSFLLKNITKDCIINAYFFNDDSQAVSSWVYGDVESYSTIRILEELAPVQNPDIDLDLDGTLLTVTIRDSQGQPIANAPFTIDVNGEKSNECTDSNGQYKVNLLGNVNVKLVYTDSNGVKTSASLIANIVLDGRKSTHIFYEDMVTTAIDTDIDGRNGKYFKIILRDDYYTPIAGKSVQFGFNGKIYNKTTDKDGMAQLQINLKRYDIYTFAVCFLGDDDYNGSFAVAKITVNKQKASLTVPAKTYKASAKTKTLTATFKSSKGNPIKGKKVSFTVNGKTYTSTTNDKGVASVNVSLNSKGTYSFTVKFAGDNTYASISNSAKLTIN